VLTAEQLRHAVFPIGDTPSRDPRGGVAARLSVADKPDSHDICFIPSGDTQAFLGADRRARGAVVDAAGTVLAEHDGVHGFTIGQRKGLGIAVRDPDGRPRYVTAIDATNGVVGGVEDLDVWSLTGQRPCSPRAWPSRRRWSARSGARARRDRARRRRVLDGALQVRLRGAARGGAGQTLVLYRPDPAGDEVLASATIA
jgi:tRNA-specific 2-thiouridylase